MTILVFILGITLTGVTGVLGVTCSRCDSSWCDLCRRDRCGWSVGSWCNSPRCFRSWQTLFVTDLLGVTVFDVTGLLGVTILDVTGLLGITILDVTCLLGVTIP